MSDFDMWARPVDYANLEAPVSLPCPRCGGRLRRAIGTDDRAAHGLACTSCRFIWLPLGAVLGPWANEEPLTIPCQYCGADMVVAAAYCVSCGSPRPGVHERLERTARRYRMPLSALRQSAWEESLLLSSLWHSVSWLEARSNELTQRIGILEARPATVDATVPRAATVERLTSPADKETDSVDEVLDLPVPDDRTEPFGAISSDELATVHGAASATIVSNKADNSAAEPASPPPIRKPTTIPRPQHPPFDLERLISGRGMAIAGGLAMLLGAIFFLSLAFSRGWIGPNARVVLGVSAAAAMILGGSRFFNRPEALIGHVLTAVGLGVLSLSMFAATQLYDQMPPEIGVTGMLIAAGVTALIAIRANLQIVAAYGLISVLIAPPFLGADNSGLTIALLGTTLVGTTAIALYRTWTWLPPLALLLTTPQLANWIVSNPHLDALPVVLAGFWWLHAIAAGGEAFRFQGVRLQPTSATLLVSNAAFLIWGGFECFDGFVIGWRGGFLLCVALAHAALGGWFLRDRGLLDPFGMLAFGTGVAALTMAIPVQFGGPIVPIGFAAEAVALAWVAGRFNHRFAGVSAVILGVLSIAHLLIFEYPLTEIANPVEADRAFLNQSGMTLAFQLLALAISMVFVRSAAFRQALSTIGFMLVIYAMPFELSGVPLVYGWSVVAVAALAVARWFPLTPAPHPTHQRWITAHFQQQGIIVPAIVAWILGFAHYLVIEIGNSVERQRPFRDGSTLAAIVLVTAALIGSFLVSRSRLQCAMRVAALTTLALLSPNELKDDAASIVVWSLLAIIAITLAKRAGGSKQYLGFASLAVGLGLLITFLFIAPLERLVVDNHVDGFLELFPRNVDHPLFWSEATVSLGALAIAFAFAYRWFPSTSMRLCLGFMAGALFVYLLSVGVVDHFQGQRGEAPLESLQKRAQVSLSILWAALGGGAFAAGIIRQWRPGRLFGLGLLGMATAKVFLYDTSSLDASYRVLSLIGLGLLLLASSYLYLRYVSPFESETAIQEDTMPVERDTPAM